MPARWSRQRPRHVLGRDRPRLGRVRSWRPRAAAQNDRGHNHRQDRASHPAGITPPDPAWFPAPWSGRAILILRTGEVLAPWDGYVTRRAGSGVSVEARASAALTAALILG